MSYEPITYCRECGDAFDVYHAPEERVCSACKEITAYRTAGFIYAYWGAPNAAPWWPRANTPSGLVQSGTVWRQAGVCSPCPYGMDVEPGLRLV